MLVFFGNCIGFHLCVSKCVPLINNSINHSILFKEKQCCSEIAWCLPWVSDGVVQFLDLTDFFGKEGGKEKIQCFLALWPSNGSWCAIKAITTAVCSFGSFLAMVDIGFLTPKFRRIFDQVCEKSQGYAKRSQKEEEKED